MRWLLKRIEIHANAYYNHTKYRKEKYYVTKQLILYGIRNIYHENNGVVGYRMMKVYLERKGIKLSDHTVHKYMNTELGLFSIVRRKKPDYHYAKAHKKFDNLINQDFSASKINQK